MLPIERIGGGQLYHTWEAHPLAAGLFFAVLEPFMGYGPNVAYGTTGITLSSTLALADMTSWGMLALGCDGSTDRSLTYTTPYDTAPFTYGCFVRPDFTSAAARDALARGNIGSGNGAIALGADASTMRYRAGVRLGGTVYYATATTNLAQRQWVFIAMSYDGADLRLYVSDLGTFTTTVNAAYTASGAGIRLGMRGTANTARWNGAVGASFGWSRVLSEAELTQIAQDLGCGWVRGWEPPARGWLTAETEQVSGQAALQGAGSLSAGGRIRWFGGAALRGASAILATGVLAGEATLILTERSAHSEAAQKRGDSDGSARIGAGEGVSRKGGEA